MKTKLILGFILGLMLFTPAFAQNQIYVNQITTAGTTTLIQVGSLNKIGSSGTPSNITGDNITFETRQMGDNNNTDFSIIGANNLSLLSVVTGNANTQKYFMDGASNTFNVSLVGNTNSLTVNKDVSVDHTSDNNTSKATIANSDVTIDVVGNSNTLKLGFENASYNWIDYNITGNSNIVKSTQIGSVGASTQKGGHFQDITILGSTNNLTVYQAGVEQQTLVYSLTGSNNTVKIIQTTTAAAPIMTTGTSNYGAANPTASISPPTP
jgi:hypothetical protein